MGVVAGIALAYSGIKLSGDTHTAIGLGAVGVVLLVAGIGAAANYWRPGCRSVWGYPPAERRP